jgi:hypothetical protein
MAGTQGSRQGFKVTLRECEFAGGDMAQQQDAARFRLRD